MLRKPQNNSESEKEKNDENEVIIGLLESETAIYNAFAANPEKGFTLLFNKYHSVLFNHAMRFVWNREVAEDIVSDVFLTFWQKKLYETINISYRAYLFKSVRNASYNFISRDINKHHSFEAENIKMDTTESPETIMHFDELKQKIESTIENLPLQCRKVFLLNRFNDKKYSEIATELGLSVKTVEMHISKALKQLKLAIKGDWLISVLVFFAF